MTAVPEPTRQLIGIDSVPEIMIDGYQGALNAGGLIKLNCFSVFIDPNDGKIKHRAILRLGMSIPALVAVSNALNDLVGQLKKDGAIKE